jgi:hypothetical protein
MKVYIAAIAKMDDTEFLGVYTTEDLALGRIEREIEKLQDSNEEYGIIPVIVESLIDDMESYT